MCAETHFGFRTITAQYLNGYVDLGEPMLAQSNSREHPRSQHSPELVLIFNSRGRVNEVGAARLGLKCEGCAPTHGGVCGSARRMDGVFLAHVFLTT
jgi:hypothetical protein